jgi:type V secretory pathway adhesin AidA
MVESSLANWDGSQISKMTTPPVPVPVSNPTQSSNDPPSPIARPQPAISISSGKDAHLGQQNGVDVLRDSSGGVADGGQVQARPLHSRQCIFVDNGAQAPPYVNPKLPLYLNMGGTSAHAVRTRTATTYKSANRVLQYRPRN